MTTKIYIPRDSSAIGMGADSVAKQVLSVSDSLNKDVEVVRNGSRGLVWMEPLLEVETESGRKGFANVAVDDVEGLVKSDFTEAGSRDKSVGLVEEVLTLKTKSVCASLETELQIQPPLKTILSTAVLEVSILRLIWTANLLSILLLIQGCVGVEGQLSRRGSSGIQS